MIVLYVLQTFLETIIEADQYLLGRIRISGRKRLAIELSFVYIIMFGMLISKLEGSFDSQHNYSVAIDDAFKL